jgi:hypothetical protein
MVTDAREPSRGYHVPSTDNKISEDMARLILALTAVGVDVAGLLEEVAGKAPAIHGHQIADIIGLAAALANKADADHVHALGGLSDVDTAGAAVYQVLTKSIDGKWRPWTIDLANAIGGAAYARLDGAMFTGEIKVPTPSTAADSLNAVNVTSLRAFVASAISALVASSPSTLDTLNELAAALGNDPNFAATITSALGNKAAKSTTITGGVGLTGGGDLSANRSLAIDFATDPETVAGLLTNKAAPPSGVHAAIAAALAGFSAGGIKGVRLITASDSVTPSAGVTKWLYFLVDGGYNGSESGQGAQFKAGSGGPGGKGSIGLVSVDPATAYSVTIGARNGGATSIVVGGVTKTSTNGILNVPSAIEDSPALVFNASTDPRWARGGTGGPGPFGFGTGGPGATVSATSSSSSGSPGTGYGAGGAGGSSGSTAGNTAGAAGSQGCLLILEF